MKTQVDAIKNHLRQNNSITSMEAFQLYGCTRLASQVFSLRKQGWDIKTLDVEGKTRYGTSCTYAKYVLVKEAE